jgi:hypothetical protein
MHLDSDAATDDARQEEIICNAKSRLIAAIPYAGAVLRVCYSKIA